METKNNTLYIEHITGEFGEDLKQHCIICGLEICNYQGAMSYPPAKITGFTEGISLYISKTTNPTIFVTAKPENSIKCTTNGN